MYVIQCKNKFYKFIDRQIFPDDVDTIEDATKFNKIEGLHLIVDVMMGIEGHDDISIVKIS